MASECNTYSCVNDPNFTIICMFIEKFSDVCGINKPSIKELCEMIENTQEVHSVLQDMHIKLLRKIKKTVPTNKWENCLAKFAYSYSNQDAWEIERFGYKNSNTSVKLRVLKALLEEQFDRNIKFKGHVNTIAAEELRSNPVGRDKFGNAYWCILDKKCNIKIFCENLDDETWSLVASNREETVQLIERLKTDDIDKIKSEEVIDDDTSSNSNLLQPENDLHTDAKESSLIIDRRVYKKNVGEIIHDKHMAPDEETTNLDVPNSCDVKTSEENSDKDSEQSNANNVKEHCTAAKEQDTNDNVEEHCTAAKEQDTNDNVEEHCTAAKEQDTNDNVEERCTAAKEQDTNDNVEGNCTASKEQDTNDNVAEHCTAAKEQDTNDNVAEHCTAAKEQDTNVIPSNSESIDSDHSTKIDERVSETVEEPVMIVTGEGTGADCETHSIFSEVIEERTFFVYGLGNGAENEMGNVKMSDNAASDKSVPKENHPKQQNAASTKQESPVNTIECPSNDLPLKKKINKHYSLSMSSAEKNKNDGISNTKTQEAAKESNDVHNTAKDEKVVKQCSERKSLETKAEKKESNNAHNSAKDEKVVKQCSEKKTFETKAETARNSAKDEKVVKQCSEKKSHETKAETARNSAKDEKIVKQCSENKSPATKARKTEQKKDGNKNQDSKITKHSESSQESSASAASDDESESEVDPLQIDKTLLPKKHNDVPGTKSTRLRKVDCEKESVKSTASKKREPCNVVKRGRRSKKGLVDGLDISQVIIDNSENGEPVVRQSRRIAQQKIQEETNRRLIEEKMLREMKAEAIKKKRATKKANSECDDEDYVVTDDESSKQSKESKTKKKKSDKPWLTSSSESSSESEQEEEEEHDRVEEMQPLKSDHEFSPESDLEDGSLVPVKRARTARVEKYSDDDDEDSSDSNTDHACQKCGKMDHPEWILLCDSCDKGYHCSCLIPVLFIIPEGDWFCPVCQHDKLILNLQSVLQQYDIYLEQLKSDEAMCKSLKNENESENIKSEVKVEGNKTSNKTNSSSSDSSDEQSDDSDSEDNIPIYKLRRRNATNISYKFNEYDELINSAINRSTLESPEPACHGKDIRTIVEAVKKEREQNQPPSSPKIEKTVTSKKNLLKKKKRKLNNLDTSSEDDDASDEDFTDAQTSASEDEEESYSNSDDSESSLDLPRTKHSRSAAKRKYDREFIDDDDNDSDASGYKIRKRAAKPKKILDDSDEFNEDELTESEEIDSEELCNDTETDSSDDNWKKRKIKPKFTKNTEPASTEHKKKPKKTNEDKSYKSGIRKRPAQIKSDSDSSKSQNGEDIPNKRRTRGKKLHYILDEDFESSDDGITPGVIRPDTPPEERERFIKKQEEIKRMLAEKNKAAAEELATPTIKPLEVNDKSKCVPLSAIPPQIIENAKILDIDFLRSSKNIDSDDSIGDELGVNFPDPDVNEDDLAKIMEEEDFAQHQLKSDDEDISKNKSISESPTKKKTKDFDSIDPAKITKPDKKLVTPVPIFKMTSETANRYHADVHGPSDQFTNAKLPAIGDQSLSQPSNYQTSFVTNSISLLQQMKQQAIPLHDPQEHRLQPSLALHDSKKIISQTIPLNTPLSVPDSKPLVAPAPATSDNLGNTVDVRRRRRKKITPLRGDLYRTTAEGVSLGPSKPMHYPFPTNSPSTMPTTVPFAYGEHKLATALSSSTSIPSEAKADPTNARFSNSGTFTTQSNYLPELCSTSSNNNTSIAPVPIPSSVPEQTSHRTFMTLEPVHTEEPTQEIPADATEPSRNNQNDTERTGEFSGLVSYFSSQQNELNA